MTKAELDLLEQVPMYLRSIAKSLSIIATAIQKEGEDDEDIVIEE